jgi:hypothetical protein
MQDEIQAQAFFIGEEWCWKQSSHHTSLMKARTYGQNGCNELGVAELLHEPSFGGSFHQNAQVGVLLGGFSNTFKTLFVCKVKTGSGQVYDNKRPRN